MQALDHPCATYTEDYGVGPFVPRLIEEYRAATVRTPKTNLAFRTSYNIF
jgi:hypothetical protein